MYKVKVENINQLDIVLKSKNASEVIIARDSFAESDLPKLVNRIKNAGKLAWILMERVSRYEENMRNVVVNATRQRSRGEQHSRGERPSAHEASLPSEVRQSALGVLCEPIDLRKSTDRIFEIENLDGIIIQNLDSFAYVLRKINKASNEKLMVELNYTMNCYNKETKAVYQKLYSDKRNNANDVPLLFTAPVELNIYELNDVGYDTMLLYSYIDTMVSANCLKKTADVKKHVGVDIIHQDVGASCASPSICKNRFSFDSVQDYSSHIIDRKGKKLYYKTYCKYCYNKIFNTEPLFLLDKIDEIFGAHRVRPYGVVVGADATRPTFEAIKCKGEDLKFRIDFSFEDAKEVENILNGKCPDSFTRGHIKNSIK